jgi:hypothetical protein
MRSAEKFTAFRTGTTRTEQISMLALLAIRCRLVPLWAMYTPGRYCEKSVICNTYEEIGVFSQQVQRAPGGRVPGLLRSPVVIRRYPTPEPGAGRGGLRPVP